MNSQHHDLIRKWIDALSVTPFEAERVQRLASELSQEMVTSTQMRHFVSTLQGAVEDPFDCTVCQEKLPEFIQAAVEYPEQVSADVGLMADVRKHLMLCPHCAAAFADVLAMTQLSLADAIPPSSSYPDFDLSFLASPASAGGKVDAEQSLQALIAQALQAGREWMEDAASGIALVFGPGLQTQTASGWAVKSSGANPLLAQVVLSDDEVEGWEIEGSVFADPDDESLCQVEVSLYNLDDADGELSGIPVTVGYSDIEVQSETDEGGVAEFNALPRDQLPHLGVYIALP